MGFNLKANVNVRPHARTLLKDISKLFTVGIFTASHICYAEEVANNLDPNREHISFLLSRNNCLQVDKNVYVKDLRVIEEFSQDSILLVDNAAYSYGFQIDNGIPCIPFYDDPEDRELMKLETYLEELSKLPIENLIPTVKQQLASYLLVESEDEISLIRKLHKSMHEPQQ